MGIEHPLLAIQRLPDQLLAAFDIELASLQGGGGFHQLLLVAAIFHHVHEGGDGTLRGAIGGNARLIEQAAAGLRRVFPGPVGQDVETPGSGMLLDKVDQVAG
ncbi:hypothetical protein D3C87_1432610 [compost metagenome]